MYQNHCKGKTAEILFELLCIKNDWHCCKPITDFMQYDYIIDRGFGFEKIQVKSVFYDKKRKQWRCDLRKSKPKGKNKEKYKDGDFDTLAINTGFNKWILIPWKSIKNRSELCLSDRSIKDELSWHFSFEHQDV